MAEPIRTEMILDTSSADAAAAALGQRIDAAVEEPRTIEVDADMGGVEGLLAEIDRLRDEAVEIEAQIEAQGLTEVTDAIDEIDGTQIGVDVGVEGTEQVEEAGEAAVEAAGGFESLSGATDDLTNKVTAGLGPLGAYVGKIAEAAGPAGVVVALAGGLALVGNRVAEVRREIAFDTGDLGADLDANLDLALGTVSEIGSELGTTATIVAQLDSRFGELGQTLRSELAQDFAVLSTTAIGAGLSVGDLRSVIDQTGESSQRSREILGLLTQGAQEYDLTVANLAQRIARNAPTLNVLGLTLEEQIDVIGRFDRAGVDFNRISRTLGTALQELAEEGQDPRDTFFELLEGVQGFARSGDNQAALALLGDYNLTGNAAIETVNALGVAVDDLDFGNLGANLERDADRIQRFHEETATAGNELKQTFGEFQEEIAPSAIIAIDAITAALSLTNSVIDSINDGLASIPDSIADPLGFIFDVSPPDAVKRLFGGDTDDPVDPLAGLDLEESLLLDEGQITRILAVWEKYGRDAATAFAAGLDEADADFAQRQADLLELAHTTFTLDLDFSGASSQILELDADIGSLTETILNSAGSVPELRDEIRDAITDSRSLGGAVKSAGIDIEGLIGGLTGTEAEFQDYRRAAIAAANATGGDAAAAAGALFSRLGPLRGALLAAGVAAYSMGDGLAYAFSQSFGVRQAQIDVAGAIENVNNLLEGQGSAGGGAARSAEDLTEATEDLAAAQLELTEAEEELAAVRAGAGGFGAAGAADARETFVRAQLDQRAADLAVTEAENARDDVNVRQLAVPQEIRDAEAALANARAGGEETASDVVKIERDLAKLREEQKDLPLDLERAEIRLAQALNRQEDAVDDVIAAYREYAEVALGAREGSDRYTEAQERVTSAAEDLKDAQDALTDSTAAGGSAAAGAAVSAEALDTAVFAAIKTFSDAALEFAGVRTEADLNRESFKLWLTEFEKLEDQLDPTGQFRQHFNDYKSDVAELVGLVLLATGRAVSRADIGADRDPRSFYPSREGTVVGPGHGGPRMLWAGEGSGPEALVGPEHPIGLTLARLDSVGVLDKILDAARPATAGMTGDTIVVESGAVQFRGAVDRAAVRDSAVVLGSTIGEYRRGRRSRMIRRVSRGQGR